MLPLCHQSTGASFSLASNIEGVSNPVGILAGTSCHLSAAKLALSTIWTYLQQLLNRKAIEQVLQNLHALQLVIGLHKGEASKYGIVEHAPALQMDA